MSSSSCTARAKQRPAVAAVRRPGPTERAFTLLLLAVWVLLMVFGLVSGLRPEWIEGAAQRGQAAEARAYKDFGDDALRRGDIPLALGQYERALEIRPDDLRVQVNRGIALARAAGPQGRGESAAAGEAALRRVLTQDCPRVLRGVVHFNLGELCKVQGRRDEAIEQYRLALAHDADPDRVERLLGGLLAQGGDIAGARVALERALTTRLDVTTPYRQMLVRSADAYADEPELRAPIEAALASGVSAGDLERYDLAFIRELSERDPDVSRILNDLGVLRIQQGQQAGDPELRQRQFAEAAANFERALAVWSENTEARENLKKLRALRGAP